MGWERGWFIHMLMIWCCGVEVLPFGWLVLYLCGYGRQDRIGMVGFVILVCLAVCRYDMRNGYPMIIRSNVFFGFVSCDEEVWE